MVFCPYKHLTQDSYLSAYIVKNQIHLIKKVLHNEKKNKVKIPIPPLFGGPTKSLFLAGLWARVFFLAPTLVRIHTSPG